MKFLLDSIWNIVTWVGIALSIGAIFLFWSKNEWASVYWSVAALAGCVGIMLLLLVKQHFWDSTKIQQMIVDPVFVNVEPTYLTGFFKDRTDFLGNQLLEPYRGKWMKVSFAVANVHDHGRWTQVLGWINHGRTDRVQISASFNEKLEREHARLFRVSDNITVAGKIVKADGTTLQLDDCRLP